jgi:sugar phosphate isomerase/epimerase
MKLGLFTPVFGKLGVREMLAKVKSLEKIKAIELGTGSWPGSDHVNVDLYLKDKNKAREFRQMIADAGLTISALSCHGDPLHPDKARAKKEDETFRKTVLLAERLEVPVVVTFSGCPGDSEGARHPNWVTAAWPPEFLDVLEWQWEKKTIPYWTRTAKFAKDHGVKIALEAHPGFIVYNVETALRLRKAVGDTWASISIRAITSGRAWMCRQPSVRWAPRSFTCMPRTSRSIRRTWRSTASSTRRRTAACRALVVVPERRYGHDEFEWKRIVSALRMAGYDYVMSIEHEDALASIDEG